MKHESFNHYSEEGYLLEETSIVEPESEKGNKCTQTNTEFPQEPTTQDEEVHKVIHIIEAEDSSNDGKVNIQQGIKDKGVIILEDTILKPEEEKTIKMFPKNFEQDEMFLLHEEFFIKRGLICSEWPECPEEDETVVLNRKPHEVKLLRGSTIG
ncbi:hypothetical protein JTB14_028688 [Gonioctena quinquepunctata]|nr:hypothetical protein JTB14_028688 [Gonioctena quinquepunctata]